MDRPLRRAAEALARGDAAAVERYMLAAWDLIPVPKTEDDDGGMLAVNLTELYRDLGKHAEARRWLAVAREAYGPGADPYTEFLAGTVHWAADEAEEAVTVFTDLYARWNTRPFHEEPPQYLAAVLARRAGEPVVLEPVPGPFTCLRPGAPIAPPQPPSGDRLADRVAARVEELCDYGDEQADDGDYRGALESWSAALALLPAPRTDWGEATWLYASIGDAHVQLGDDAAAQAALVDALNCPDGAATGYVHYLLGVSMLRTGDARAVDHLVRAYALEGQGIFDDDGETGRRALSAIAEVVR